MELTLEQALQKGIEAHRSGKAQEADQYYTAILKASPKHPDANHNMGVLAVGVGKVQAALPFFKTALEANANIAQFWLSYIDALIKLDRMDDARAVFEQARSHGVNGEAFDQIEKRFGSAVSKFLKVREPPKEQLQNLINLHVQGQHAGALSGAEKLLKQFPDSFNLYNIIGAANKALGKLDEAIGAYKKALSIEPKNFDVYLNLGIVFTLQGKLKDAVETFNIALSVNPNSSNVYFCKGNALKSDGKLDEAIDAYHKALLLQPNYAEACFNMGNAYKDLGVAEKAVESYKRVISINPDFTGAYNNLGTALKSQGNLKEAIEAYKKVISIKPDYAEAYNNMGNALHEQGKLDDAIEAYDNALAIKPDYAEAYNSIGNIHQTQGKLEEAIEFYEKAIEINPDYSEAYNNIGTNLYSQAELGAAISWFKKAILMNANNEKAYLNMGNALKNQGKIEEAIQALDKAISIKPDYGEAHRSLSNIKKYTVKDPHFIYAKKLYDGKDHSEEIRCNLNFALAKMYEDVGEFNKAFDHLLEGNSLRKKLLNYSIGQDKIFFEQLKKFQTSIFENSLERKKSFNGPRPIFILGMPRSGTTLVEQIISSHTRVTGAGELNQVRRFGLDLAIGETSSNKESILEFRDNYLLELGKLSKGNQCVTDKMPHNFLFIPLICAALPEAKIIHVKRDPVATCWSNFKQYFVSTALGYCYDLKDTVEYYKLYLDLMKLWQSQYSNKIYNLNYETLTTDQENETRRLISYLDLTWEDACLYPQENTRIVKTASKQQVRQKVYKGSSEAWRKYEPYLDGIFDGLVSG